MEPAIIVHGGAVLFPGEKKERALEGTKTAALKAYRLLMQGRSAIDAVQAAICVLEDDPAFDAGVYIYLLSLQMKSLSLLNHL